MTYAEITQLSDDHPIIIFDGVCNLCNGFVNSLIRTDKKELFRYATLQHQELPDEAKNIDTVFLLHKRELYDRSDVALKSAQILGLPYAVLSIFMIVPKFIRDAVYTMIAKNRYRLFGKKETCMVPTPEVKRLFLN